MNHVIGKEKKSRNKNIRNSGEEACEDPPREDIEREDIFAVCD